MTEQEYTDEQFWADMKAYLETLPAEVDIEETIIIIEEPVHANSQ